MSKGFKIVMILVVIVAGAGYFYLNRPSQQGLSDDELRVVREMVAKTKATQKKNFPTPAAVPSPSPSPSAS